MVLKARSAAKVTQWTAARKREPLPGKEEEQSARGKEGRKRRNELKAQWRPPEAVIYGGITGGGISS